MEKRRIGMSDLHVYPIGLGCMEIGGSMKDLERYLVQENGNSNDHIFSLGSVQEKEAVDALRYAFDNGVNFLDTAPAYGAGNSEIVIGKAVRGIRDKIVIATKFGKKIDTDDHSFGRYDSESELIHNIKRECESSLMRLHTDFIDVLQYHQMDYDLLGYRDEVLGILEKLVTEGKIRYYGWSTESVECASAFSTGEHFIMVQFNNNYIQSADSMLQFCENNRLGAVCRGILGMGFLSGKYTRNNYRELLDSNDFRHRDIENFLKLADSVEKVMDIFVEDGRSAAEGAIGWLLGISDIAVPILGFRTLDQVENNIRSVELGPLPAERIRRIERRLGAGK